MRDNNLQDVTDSTVGGKPHCGVRLNRVQSVVAWAGTRELTLLQLEFFNTALIRSDGGTLDTNTILLDSLCGVVGNLVVGLVTVFNTLCTGSQLAVPDRKVSSRAPTKS